MRSNPTHSRRANASMEKALVGFFVGEGYYAVDVPSVREIVTPTALRQVPHSAPIVSGVTDHRGRVVPVVDLRVRFGLGPHDATRRAKWIIVEVGTNWLGLAVDSVTEVFSVNAALARETPRLGPDDVARGFSGVYAYDQNLVLVLDLAILSRAVTEGGGSIAPPSWKPSSDRHSKPPGGMA